MAAQIPPPQHAAERYTSFQQALLKEFIKKEEDFQTLRSKILEEFVSTGDDDETPVTRTPNPLWKDLNESFDLLTKRVRVIAALITNPTVEEQSRIFFYFRMRNSCTNSLLKQYMADGPLSIIMEYLEGDDQIKFRSDDDRSVTYRDEFDEIVDVMDEIFPEDSTDDENSQIERIKALMTKANRFSSLDHGEEEAKRP